MYPDINLVTLKVSLTMCQAKIKQHRKLKQLLDQSTITTGGAAGIELMTDIASRHYMQQFNSKQTCNYAMKTIKENKYVFGR